MTPFLSRGVPRIARRCRAIQLLCTALLLFAISFCSVVIFGQTKPNENTEKKLLELTEAIKLTLQNNKQIEISRDNVKIAEIELNKVRDSGDKSRPVRVAKRTMDLADTKFRQVAVEVIAKVVYAYWDLAYAIADLQLKAESLKQTRDLLGENARYIDNRQLDPIDRVVVEVQESNLLLANFDTTATLIQSENALKYLMAINRQDPLWNVSLRLIPTTSANEQTAEGLSLPDALRAAMENRFELRLNKIAGEINQIDQEFNKGQGKASLAKSVLESQQLRTQREQLELQIEVEVRNEFQIIHNADGRVLAAMTARKSLEHLYDVEEKKFRTGESNTKGILAMQTLLLNARLVELRASTDRAKALAELQRLTASILARN